MAEPGPSNKWALPPIIPNFCAPHRRHNCFLCSGRPSLQSPPRPTHEPPILSYKYNALQDELEDKPWLKMIKELKTHWPRARVLAYEDTYIEQNLLEEYYTWSFRASMESEARGEGRETAFFAELARDILVETEAVVGEIEVVMQGENLGTVDEGRRMRGEIKALLEGMERGLGELVEEERRSRGKTVGKESGAMKVVKELMGILGLRRDVMRDEYPADGADAQTVAVGELLVAHAALEAQNEEAQTTFHSHLVELLTDEERKTGVYDEDEVESRLQANEAMVAEVEALGALGTQLEVFKDEAVAQLAADASAMFTQALERREELNAKTAELDERHMGHIEEELTQEERETGEYDEDDLERRCEANPVLMMEIDVRSVLRLDVSEHGVDTVKQVLDNKIAELESAIAAAVANTASEAALPPLADEDLATLIAATPHLRQQADEIKLLKRRYVELSSALEKLEGTLDAAFLRPLFERWKQTREIRIRETDGWLKARRVPKEVWVRQPVQKARVEKRVVQARKVEEVIGARQDEKSALTLGVKQSAGEEKGETGLGIVLVASSIGIVVMWFLILRVVAEVSSLDSK